VGATDSAAPCAILLDVAEALNPLLDKRKAALLREGDDEHGDNPAAHTTLQLIFFDGEEAFKDWTHTDSIYGARCVCEVLAAFGLKINLCFAHRHLAERWENEYVAPHPKIRNDRAPTVLSTIEHFVLLDLLGAENPKISSYYLPTRWLFDALVSVESRVDKAGLSTVARDRNKKASTRPIGEKVIHGRSESFFQPQGTARFGWIEDDHTPFLQRGVSVLHVISNPFPRVWHTIKVSTLEPRLRA
jgi:glutaminyl-peptide cyclotransferase